MENLQSTINVILKAVALGMGTAVIVLGIMGVVDAAAQVPMLGIGLFALALWSLRKQSDSAQV